jgi:hypothetical protein
MQKLALLADRECAQSMALCDVVAGTAPARRFLVDCPADGDAQPPWTRAGLHAIRMEVLCSGWIVYVGNATPTSWRVRDAGKVLDAAWVAKLYGGDALRPVVFSVGGDTGRFMCRAPSERYVDESGRTHEFVRDDGRPCRVSNYDPFSSDYDQGCEEAYASTHPDYASRCNASAVGRLWRDKVNEETVRGRLTVPRPCNYDLPANRNRTFACSWLLARGGAIVFAGESLPCPSDTGAEFVHDVVAGRTAGPCVFGDLWIAGQQKYWLDNRTSEGVFRNPRAYLGIMTLFGDPSLRIPGGKDAPK